MSQLNTFVGKIYAYAGMPHSVTFALMALKFGCGMRLGCRHSVVYAKKEVSAMAMKNGILFRSLPRPALDGVPIRIGPRLMRHANQPQVIHMSKHHKSETLFQMRTARTGMLHK